MTRYLERYEEILKLEVTQAIKVEQSEQLVANLLEEIHNILNLPIHFRNMEPEERKKLNALYSKMTNESRREYEKIRKG